MPTPFPLDEILSWPWAEAVTLLFGFAWGAMLGSFINVVAHRLPRGESIVRHRSHCPGCGAAVRATDNVPVIGWLRLGGRCRDCGGAIAIRYPLIEAGCGTMTMLLAWSELVGGGRWLPRMAGVYPEGIDRLLRGDWSLLLACFLHAAVALCVVTWSLLDLAGWRPKSPWNWLPILAATAMVAGVPTIGPGGGLPSGADWPPAPPWAGAAGASLVGAAWGWLLGRLGAGSGIRLGLPLLGTVLGWQAVTVAAAATAATWRVVTTSRPAPPGSAGLLAAAFGALCLAFQGPIHSAVSQSLAFVVPH